MREWNELTNQEQIYLYWDYCANIPDCDEEPISFSEFDEMMQGFTFE